MKLKGSRRNVSQDMTALTRLNFRLAILGSGKVCYLCVLSASSAKCE